MTDGNMCQDSGGNKSIIAGNSLIDKSINIITQFSQLYTFLKIEFFNIELNCSQRPLSIKWHEIQCAKRTKCHIHSAICIGEYIFWKLVTEMTNSQSLIASYFSGNWKFSNSVDNLVWCHQFIDRKKIQIDYTIGTFISSVLIHYVHDSIGNAKYSWEIGISMHNIYNIYTYDILM